MQFNMQRITPFLWFDGKAEEAIKLYTSVFKNSKIINISYWAPGSFNHLPSSIN